MKSLRDLFKCESTLGIAPKTYKHLDHVNLFDKTFGNLQEMGQRVQRINMLLETLLECGEHNSKLTFPETTQVDNEALDHVEECLDILRTGIMVGLHPQEAALGQYYLESQIKVVESVKADFKKLSEAIKALRKEQHEQEDQEERQG